MLVAVASVKGSPGVTTLAMAMALQWPAVQRAVVVEADPAGGDVAARFGLSGSPGLISLAAAARRHAHALLDEHTQQLFGGRLGVVPGGVGAEQARAAVTALVSAGHQWVSRTEATVIVDCGRWDAASPATPLLQAADAILVLARPRAEELSHLAARLPPAAPRRGVPGLVLAGHRGYPPSHIQQALRTPVVAVVPVDPAGAAVLRGDRAWRQRTGRGPLLSAAAEIVRWLAPSLCHRTPAQERIVFQTGQTDGSVWSGMSWVAPTSKVVRS